MSAPGLTWLTGASSGIGEALALELAGRGQTLAISARSADKLAAVAGKAAAGRLHPVPVDITDLDAARAAVDRIEAEHGPITRVILNAGTFQPDGVTDGLSGDSIRKHIEINVLGTINCLDPLLPRFLERGAGHLVIVSSVAGYRGLPRSVGYSSSKAALIAMAEALRLELHPRGIKVQVVCPGFIETPLTEKNDFAMPMLMKVEDAVSSFADQLEKDRFEIRFPWLFAFLMKRLSHLPYGLYFGLVGKAVDRGKAKSQNG